MPRKKQYIEGEVIDKAMQLFWKNGYGNTSMQMLEKEMGINKFSIYSSFGSKRGVFVESLKAYEVKTNAMFAKFQNATQGLADIKTFFYDSVAFCDLEGSHKGCLVTNTYNEFAETQDADIKTEMNVFMVNLKQLFTEKIRLNSTEDEATIVKQANYLLLAKHGLAAASKVNTKEEIEDYIEMTFNNI